MNLLKVVAILVRCCTSFGFCGGCKPWMGLI